MSTHDYLSYDTNIPMAMWFDEKIEAVSIKLYAIIRGLSNKFGYCFATNDYLSDVMKASVSSIKRWLLMLKEAGYIEIETAKNGVQWQRRIHISDKFKKSLRRSMDELPPAHTRTPPSSPVSHIIKEYSNKEVLKEREEAPPLPPTQFMQIFKRVRMESQKYDALVAEFGEAKIREMMDRLDEYADINPKRFKQYACHAAVIRKWLRDDAKKSQDNPTRPSKETAQQLAQKVAQKYPGIEALANGILFINQGAGQDIHIDYKEYGFRDQVLNRLRKMGLSVEGL